MSKSPKIDRKTLKTPDAFQAQGRGYLSGLEGKGREIIIALGLIVVLVCGYYANKWWQAKSLVKSWEEYVAIEKLADDQKWPALEKFAKENSSTRAGMLAALAIADKAFDDRKKARDGGAAAEQKSRAVDWYTVALEYGKAEDFEKQLLLVNRGKSWEIEGNLDEALNDYQSAAGLTGKGRAAALLSIGRVWELKGAPEKANEQYQKLAAEFPDSQYARLAQGYQRLNLSTSGSTSKQ